MTLQLPHSSTSTPQLSSKYVWKKCSSSLQSSVCNSCQFCFSTTAQIRSDVEFWNLHSATNNPVKSIFFYFHLLVWLVVLKSNDVKHWHNPPMLFIPSKVHPILQYTSIYANLRIFDQEVRYCTHCVRLYGSKRPK